MGRKKSVNFKTQTLIPMDIRGAMCSDTEALEILKNIGVVFGRTAGKYSHLRHIVLEKGLTKVMVPGTYFSDLVDAQGRVRARIFMNNGVGYVDVCTRFTVMVTMGSVSAMDGTAVLHRVMLLSKYANEDARQELLDAKRKVERWLSDRYPRWRHPAMYWDEG